MNPDDLDASDTLLVKADALIHRHRTGGTHDPDDDLPLLDDVVGEDLPLLDDITSLPEPEAVDAPALPATAEAAPTRVAELEAQVAQLEDELAEQREALARASESHDAVLKRAVTAEEAASRTTVSSQATRMAVAEQLIDLDARISQKLEAWLGDELPQIVATELDGMVERLRMKTLAHMRATLIPELSAKLSEVLDATVHDRVSGD
jgi:hypothetical protein